MGMYVLLTVSLRQKGSAESRPLAPEQEHGRVEGRGGPHVSLGKVPPPTCWAHLWSSSLWFESFQNWQSESLAVPALVVLTIFLRQKDASQSKPMDAPHAQTGA